MLKSRKTSVSDCHYTTYQTKSNGLWNYYVCNKCGNKTEPIKVWNKLVN
jgi:hypothetical protein